MTEILLKYGWAPNHWVLDAFCGSGSMAHATIMSGMHCFSFDKEHYKLQATIYRATHFREMKSAADEVACPVAPEDEKQLEAQESREAAAQKKKEDDAKVKQDGWRLAAADEDVRAKLS